MKRTILLVLIVLFLFAVQVKADWLSGWAYRKQITINHSKIDSDLTDFQMAVIINSSDTNFWNHCNSRENLVFTSSDGTTELYSEVERFDNTTDKLEAWVRVPSVSSSADTIIYMYYDSSSPTHGKADSTSTWGGHDYRGVWHYKDSGTTVYDSSGNHNNGIKTGTVNNVNGKISQGYDFPNQDNSFIGVNSSSTSLNFHQSGTFMYWIKVNTYQNFGNYRTANDWETYWLDYIGNNSYGEYNWLEAYLFINGAWKSIKVNNFFDGTGVWTHVAQVYDYTAGGYHLYKNGVEVGKLSVSGNLGSSVSDLWLSGTNYPSFYSVNATYDEPKILAEALSAAFVKAIVNSENNSLISWESEETPGLEIPLWLFAGVGIIVIVVIAMAVYLKYHSKSGAE
jgi:hypothetical protein